MEEMVWPLPSRKASNAPACAVVRKSVENESRRVGVLVDLRLQHLDGDVVGHKLTLIHVALGQLAQLCLSLDVGAENVSSAQVNQVVVVDKEGALGAFTRTRRAKQNQVAHRFVPFVNSFVKTRR